MFRVSKPIKEIVESIDSTPLKWEPSSSGVAGIFNLTSLGEGVEIFDIGNVMPFMHFTSVIEVKLYGNHFPCTNADKRAIEKAAKRWSRKQPISSWFKINWEG